MTSPFDPKRNTIFLDMDGVLADFHRLLLERFGRTFDAGRQEVPWAALSKIDRLYFQLEPLPTAFELWDLAHSLGARVEVLTAIPRRSTIPTAEADKRDWIAKHFGTSTPVRIGPFSRDKWKHAAPGDVLVDDRADNIVDWTTKAAGVGVLYTSFDQAAADLKRVSGRQSQSSSKVV